MQPNFLRGPQYQKGGNQELGGSASTEIQDILQSSQGGMSKFVIDTVMQCANLLEKENYDYIIALCRTALKIDNITLDEAVILKQRLGLGYYKSDRINLAITYREEIIASTEDKERLRVMRLMNLCFLKYAYQAKNMKAELGVIEDKIAMIGPMYSQHPMVSQSYNDEFDMFARHALLGND